MGCLGVERETLSDRLGGASLKIVCIPGSKHAVERVEDSTIVSKDVRDELDVKLHGLEGKRVFLGGFAQEALGLKFRREVCIQVLGEGAAHLEKPLGHFLRTDCFRPPHTAKTVG